MCACMFSASAHAEKISDPQLDRIIGKAFLILAEEYIVSGEGNDCPKLWVNAKLGKVAHPTSKMLNSGTRWEREMVPTETGIVLRFIPPFDPNEASKHWMTSHDAEARHFEIIIPLPDKRIIGITGNYGCAFQKKYIDQLIALSKSK